MAADRGCPKPVRVDGLRSRQYAGQPKSNAILVKKKQASASAKIDPLMGAFNAVAWMSPNPASSQPSIFVI
jgi:phage terminase large subunit-like protein